MEDINNKLNKFIESVDMGMSTEVAKDISYLEKIEVKGLDMDNIESLSLINDILKKKKLIRVYLVLLMKGYTWNRELTNNFNIPRFKIKESLEYFHNNGLIIMRDFYSIDMIYQQVIYELSPDFEHWIVNNPSIYIVSAKGNLLGTKILEYLEKIVLKDSSLRDTYAFIRQKTAAARKRLSQLEEIDNKYYQKNIKSPFQDMGSAEIIIETDKYIQAKKELGYKTDRERFEEQQKQLKSQSVKQLAGEEESLEDARIGKDSKSVDEQVKERQKGLMELLGIE